MHSPFNVLVSGQVLLPHITIDLELAWDFCEGLHHAASILPWNRPMDLRGDAFVFLSSRVLVLRMETWYEAVWLIWNVHALTFSWKYQRGYIVLELDRIWLCFMVVTGQGKEDGVAILHGTVRIFWGSVWLSSMFWLLHVRIVFQLQINPAGRAWHRLLPRIQIYCSY